MKKEDFIYNDNCETPLNGSSHWESPSNIALVKYWGKSWYYGIPRGRHQNKKIII